MAEVSADLARREEFTPPALVSLPQSTTFLLSVPTADEFDRLPWRLYQLGVDTVSTQTARAILVEELYAVYDQAEADEHATFLDDFWQRRESQDAASERWKAQEAQSVLDRAAGRPPRALGPIPQPLVSAREKARAQLIFDHVSKSSLRMQEVVRRQAGARQEVAVMMTRLVVKRAFPGPGANGTFQLGIDFEGDVLTESSCNAIRAWIGEAAWTELVLHAAGLWFFSRAGERAITWSADLASSGAWSTAGGESKAGAVSLH